MGWHKQLLATGKTVADKMGRLQNGWRAIGEGQKRLGRNEPSVLKGGRCGTLFKHRPGHRVTQRAAIRHC